MIDLSRIKYHVIVIDEAGKQYHIGDYLQNLGWEENKNEIAPRSSFTVKNDRTAKGYLSNIIKPGCLVGIFASDGTTEREVTRGYVETWNSEEKNSGDSLKCTCYDELYKLQKSQDNRYFPSGTGTKSALLQIFNDWGIPVGEYHGPNATHGKMVYNNEYLSDIILKLLDDAMKKVGGHYIIRAEKGCVSVIPRGDNKTVYVFQVDNVKSFAQSISTANLITRVKVVGQANDDGKRSVEATVNGEINYGVRQRIYIRGSDETLGDAKAAAQEILKEEGKIEQEMTVESPDVPFIRKGDLVYLISGQISGYYYVQGIRHDAEMGSMTMELSYAGAEKDKGSEEQKRKKYQVGDIVNFHGGTHYVSSYPGAKGYVARAGKAKITIKNGSGKAHPWHLIHADSGSNVYGWVDDGTFD